MEELKDLLKEILKEDHEILVRLDVTMNMLMSQVGDHEKRIRLIERALFYGLGVLGVAKIAWDGFHR